MKSGIASNHSWGQIISADNADSDWVYANYYAVRGDSGAPVGKVSGSNISIYGIHRGDSPDYSYEAYVSYDTLKSYLDLD